MTFPDSSRLLIVGASTRAAAASAARAGFHPVCVDRFGDEDLRRIATVLAVNDDLHRTLDSILALPPMPWIYTGSVENDPKFIAKVSERHALLGNPPSVLKLVRDPFWLERTLRTHDMPALRVCSVCSLAALGRASESSAEGGQATRDSWLLKPMRSGGGFRITHWTGQSLPTNERFCLQEHRSGTPMSALFIASANEVELIGVCEQLIGPAFGAPTEFGYAGSIGPMVVSDRIRELLQRLGNTLTREAQLRGVFGIDFILADDIPWLVELNPRYTASVEVLERSLGRALLADLRSVPLTSSLSPQRGEGRKTHASVMPTSPRIVGKQIVFATRDLTAPALETLFEPVGHTPNSPVIADIPAPGTRIVAGWPICTVFAEGQSVAECSARLAVRRQSLLNALGD
jgi:predicted ATP-grasp superfamily ATP-dependent carboligase